jgi:peptidyl-prolyl cis-trans isomerase B (cyclophilin B)
MPEHKAPTAVTVAPLSERSLIERWVAKYWVHFTLLLLAVLAGVVVKHFLQRSSIEKEESIWSTLTSQTTPNAYTQIPEGDPERLARTAEELKDSSAGPTARIIEIYSRIGEQDYSGARAALERLRGDYPDHPLVRGSFLEDGGATITLPDQFARRIDALEAWEKSHAEWRANPPLPEGAPRVRLVTSKGSIVVGLYADLAPLHAANFLKHCQEKVYDGTLFHRVVPGFMIQGGDPNTKDRENKSQWGQGGDEGKLDPEYNRLRHFSGVLSAAKKPGEAQSSGTQFFITTDAAHHLNGQHVVFGVVLEGIDVVQQIVAGAVDPESPGRDRPLEPVSIDSTEVL